MEIDRWALLRLEQVREKVTQAYDAYEFHTLYHTVHNFCAIDLSSIYLDILKDRVYTAKPDSVERRAAQTAMYEILDTLVRLVSPVLTFSAEEVWQHMPKVAGMPESIQLADWPAARSEYLDKQLEDKWNKLLTVRSELTKALEQARRTKVIGHSLDAAIAIYASDDVYEQLNALGEELATLLIVSKANVKQGVQQAPDNAYRSAELPLAVVVTPAQGEKCERCWIYSDTIGEDSEHGTLCERCAGVLKA